MTLNNENDALIREYLLGELPEEKLGEIEMKLLADESFAGHVSIVEDELIEDYVFETLTSHDRRRFEQYFLSTPERRRMLLFIKSLKSDFTNGDKNGTPGAQPGDGDSPRPRAKAARSGSLFFAWWKPIAGAAAAAAAIAIVCWFALTTDAQVKKGLEELHKTYTASRPNRSRITGFPYAPFLVTRGPNEGDGKDEQRDFAKALLHEAAKENPNAVSLHALGRLYLAGGEFDKAIRKFRDALTGALRNAQLHGDLGAALLEKAMRERTDVHSNDSEETLAASLEQFNEALSLDASQPEAIFNRALVYEEFKLYRLAKADFEAYLKYDPGSSWAEEVKDKLKSIDAGNKMTTPREEQLFQDYLQAYRDGNDERIWEAFKRGHLRNGNVIANKLLDEFLFHSLNGRKREAAERLQALDGLGEISLKKTGDRFTSTLAGFYRQTTTPQLLKLARARQAMRSAYEKYRAGPIEGAITAFEQSRLLFEQTGNAAEAMVAAYWIGHCYDARENSTDGLSRLGKTLRESEQRGFLWLQSMALSAISLAQSGLAEHSEAISASLRALKLSTRLQDENGELRNSNNLAGLYRGVGKYRDALRIAHRGLELAEDISADSSQRIGFYSTSAWSFNALGFYPAALAFQQETVRLADETPNPLARSRSRIHLGLIYRKLGRHAEAIEQINSGLAFGNAESDSEVRLQMNQYARLNLAQVYSDTGEFEKAKAEFGQVVDFATERNSQWMLYLARKGQLRNSIKKRDVPAAHEELRLVLDLFEKQREKIQEESNRGSFFDSEQSIHDLAIHFARSELHDPVKAFDYSERSRARSLLDASEMDRRVIIDDSAPDLRLRRASPPLGVEEIRRRMPEQVQILQYASLEDKLIIWLVAPNRFEEREVRIPRRDLESLVHDYLNQIAQRPGSAGDPPLETGKELYSQLIEPIEAALDRGKTLCIIPDKSLTLLPFGALVSTRSDKFLIEEFALLHSSSATLFVNRSEQMAARMKNQKEVLLSVGNPAFDRKQNPEMADLPLAADEASGVAAFYESPTLLIKHRATKSAVTDALAKANVAHLAVHNLPDHRRPMRSKLLLAPSTSVNRPGAEDSGALAAHELYRLDLSSLHLVILSVCQSRTESYSSGEGAMGISRPFEAAGIPLIIASLWPVDDSPAIRDLMIRFHQNRKRSGLPTVEALKASQTNLLRSSESRYRHPYYWASFVVVGGYGDL